MWLKCARVIKTREIYNSDYCNIQIIATFWADLVSSLDVAIKRIWLYIYKYIDLSGQI